MAPASAGANRRARALVALVVALPALTGCIAAPWVDQGLTARQAATTAQEEAADWAEDARLVEVSTVGPVRASGALDGDATSWLVTLWSPAEKRARAVLVHADGTAGASELEDPPSHARALGTHWTLDSPQALEVAREDARFEQAATVDQARLSLALWADDRGPRWVLMAWSTQADTSRLLHVSAEDGTVLATGDPEEPAPGGPMPAPVGVVS